ncbi:MAG: helix-turn-helix transcriptional regulator [Gammaproteobacteria bacterium]|nr:helix-turn-helix transcriptional regulator [Gammaproteobacteria bacterium]
MMTENFSSLSLRLKYALNVLGFSQTELARRINVKPQVIQYLCSSCSQKSRFTLEIAESLNIDFTWLATGRGILPKKLELLNVKNSIPLLSFPQIREWVVDGNEINYSNVNTWLSSSGVIKPNSYAVMINDRAMAPRFDLATIIIIERIKTNRIENNSFILVYLFEENFIVFRQLSISKKNRCLIAINKSLHKDIILREKDKILGVCTEARWSV